MNERITFVITKKFKKALENYCSDRNITISSFVKSVVAEELIKENYLEVSKHELD